MTNQNLAVTFYKPQGRVDGCLEIVHGMAEHRKRYSDFAKYLNEKGWAVITYDLPGHGESVTDDKDLGWFGEENGWKLLTDSAVYIMNKAKAEYPDVPFVLMGHSMGTIIVRCLMQDHDARLDGVILSGAPNYQKAVPAGIAMAKVIRLFKGKRGYSKTLDQMITGNFNKSVKNPRTSVDWLSYNTENVDRYIADPYCGFPFTIQGYIDEMEGLVQMHDVSRYHCTNKDLPILFFAGKEDPCIGGEEGLSDSISTLRQAGYQQIDTKLFEGMRHETLNEKECEKVFETAWQWLAKRGKVN